MFRCSKTYIIQAETGVAFDDKDYSSFVQSSKECLALDTTVANSRAAVAWEYAFEYEGKGLDSAILESAQVGRKASQCTNGNFIILTNTVLRFQKIIRQWQYVFYPDGI